MVIKKIVKIIQMQESLQQWQEKDLPMAAFSNSKGFQLVAARRIFVKEFYC